MPDVVESRKQAAVKTQNVKTEPTNTNGEGETSQNCCKDAFLIYFNLNLYLANELDAGNWNLDKVVPAGAFRVAYANSFLVTNKCFYSVGT